MRRAATLLLTLAGVCAGTSLAAQIRVTDARGHAVMLDRPAQRIISLAPHITELLFAAGAGDRVVGVVDYSDYPEAAKHLPRIGNLRALDLERIVALKPDLVVVWLHGSSMRQLDRVAALGLPIFHSEPRRLEDVAIELDRLGVLAGTEVAAARAAQAYRARLAGLRARYAGRRPIDVFYQVWTRPLLTVNDQHLISRVLRLCGGRNVFGALAPLVPEVSIEAVVVANPRAILTASVAPEYDREALALWHDWPRIAAVARGNLYTIDADLISRDTPRILDAAQAVCERLDAARREAAR
ncbi:MAG: cobalamin-binding protein [Betaproteobacteria bacterium]|nr:cobalamin-binding protein [Betaproteobacteria bacterium]